MSLNLTTLLPAKINTSEIATKYDVSSSIAAYNPANYINANTTTIDGGKITTGTISADQIAANAITAGKISAGAINGYTIEGTTIKGAYIEGAVIKASYLDLDGQIQVLTNFHITIATYTSNPSLYPDAILLSSEYRLPSFSSVSDFGGASFTRVRYAGGTSTAYGFRVNDIAYGKLGTYDSHSVAGTNRCVKIRPSFTIIGFTILSGYATASAGNATTDFSIRFGLITLLTFRLVSIDSGASTLSTLSNPSGLSVSYSVVSDQWGDPYSITVDSATNWTPLVDLNGNSDLGFNIICIAHSGTSYDYTSGTMQIPANKISVNNML